MVFIVSYENFIIGFFTTEKKAKSLIKEFSYEFVSSCVVSKARKNGIHSKKLIKDELHRATDIIINLCVIQELPEMNAANIPHLDKFNIEVLKEDMDSIVPYQLDMLL